MPKICNHDGCNYNQFGGGFCKFHQFKRKDFQTISFSRNVKLDGKRIFKKKPRKITEKQKIKNKKKAKLSEKDKLFWAAIWEEREHVCYNCGCYLGEEPLTLFFDHILEKGSQLYAHLR